LGGTTVATQLGTIRALLMAEDGPAIGSPLSAAFQSAAEGQMILIVKVTHADIMARLISLKLQVEEAKRSKMRMVFEGASEAHLLAAEIAKADIGVIVAPSRPFPYSSEDSRCLPGVPLTNDTLVSTLWRAGVTTAIGTRNDLPMPISASFTTRWELANLIADTTVNLSSLDVLAMATTNLEKLYGLSDKPDIARWLEKDFVAYHGGGMMSFGGSKVVAFSTPGGVAVL
ncbi:MAG: hypothetical protein TREMPRED_002308, partial [Tremellales sp. Tagirdzhanova-0007]